MNPNRQLVVDLYAHLLRRTPGEIELDHWIKVLDAGEAFESVFYKFIRSPEGRSRHGTNCKFPAGHFHSPVVNPATVRQYVDWSASQQIAGIELDIEEMQQFFERNLPLFRATEFSQTPSPHARYHIDGSPFPYGDALTLRGMIAERQPQLIIEIGSGSSTAVMLDAVELLNIKPRIICIEPYADRLRSLMWPGDTRIVEIVERDVQTVPLGTFKMLKANDILFIDSTHVLKTGSDVHYQLFHILPALEPGVLVHVHDVQYPFEYPPKWIYEDNYSWNEAYGLRAFLMYNKRFRVLYWSSYFRRLRDAWLRKQFPDMITQNPGGSIWLQVTSDQS